MQVTSVPFRPIWGTTIQCPATSGSSRVAIPATAKYANVVRVVHVLGTGDVRFRAGDSTVAAVTLTDPIVRANTPITPETFGINTSDTHIAVITDTGTGTLEFTFGVGK